MTVNNVKYVESRDRFVTYANNSWDEVRATYIRKFVKVVWTTLIVKTFN